MTPFPWSDAIGFGLGVLKLSPQQFWQMTPRELAYAIKAVRGDAPAPIDRGAFDALLLKYPDHGADNGR